MGALNVLRRLKAEYPGHADVQQWDHPHLTSELLYFQEHGLVTVGLNPDISLMKPQAIFASLTAKGIDFLQDDCGLSAILDVVTIRIDDDSIKRMVEAKIMASDMPPPGRRAA